MAKRPLRLYYTTILHELNWPTLQDRCKNNFLQISNFLVAPHHYFLSPSFPITRAKHQLKFSHYQTRTQINFFPKAAIDWNYLLYPDLCEIVKFSLRNLGSTCLIN